MISDSALMPWTRPLNLETAFPPGVFGPQLRLLLALFAASRAGLISRFGFAPASCPGPGSNPASTRSWCSDMPSLTLFDRCIARLPARRDPVVASPERFLNKHYRESRPSRSHHSANAGATRDGIDPALMTCPVEGGIPGQPMTLGAPT